MKERRAMSAAARMDTARLHVTQAALEQRLSLEIGTASERQYALNERRELVKGLIRDEIATARMLVPAARKVVSLVEREAHHGEAIPLRKRVRRGRESSAPFSRNGGEFFLTPDSQVCYLVDHSAVVTALSLTEAQLQTIEGIMGPPDTLIPMTAILARIREEPPVSRERLRYVGWLAPVQAPPLKNVLWTFVVMEAARPDLPVHDVVRRLYAVYDKTVAGTMFQQGALSRGLKKAMRSRLGPYVLKSLPLPPIIDWSSVEGKDAKRRVALWMSRVLTEGGQERRLITFLTEATARGVLEVVDGAGDAAWRTDPDFFRPGAVHSVTVNL